MSLTRREVLSLAAAASLRAAAPRRTVFVVPNFHPASCGWLTNFSKERVYCANSYLDHLDRVRDDPKYAFVLSEVNNLIAILNFQPDRARELKQRVAEGRVELVNAFFLESTVNLSGGEALVRLALEGLRWQKAVFDARPRFAWTIDVCGTHEQMAQICAGLRLDAMVYTRKNPTGSALHWAESPDGSRILAISPGHYSEFQPVMKATEPLAEKDLAALEKYFDQKQKGTPAGAPILVLAGSGDYALAPACKQYPGEFLAQWHKFCPDTDVRFATLGQYADAVLPAIQSGKLQLPVMRGGTAFDFDAFWIQNPRVKSWFRRNEHALQTAEAAASIASLQSAYAYPARELYQGWLQMFLNMDRNTLWGAAGGMVFESETSWDARDRLEWVTKHAAEIGQAALRGLSKPGAGVAWFNPLNWRRHDPIVLPDGSVVCRELPAAGMVAFHPDTTPPPARERPAAGRIETRHYSAAFDSKTGALASLKMKPSGREMLGGAANTIVAERPKQQHGDTGNHMAARAGRTAVDSTAHYANSIAVSEGPLATVVKVEGQLCGQPCRRTVRLYHDYPRIDFETELNDIPDRTVVVAEFPLAGAIAEARRGIPYGFSQGVRQGITPAVRWSHYTLAEGGGVALLDRGLTGREVNERTPILYLCNASEKYYGYPNSWLSGKGRQRLEYALVAHEGAWEAARIPRMAWEYNAPPTVLDGAAPAPAKSYLETSDNLIVESVRRTGPLLELRMVECLGAAGTAEVRLALAHKGATMTDLLGNRLSALRGGGRYRFPIRAQQIVTLRFDVERAVEIPEPLMSWDELVPEPKRPALHEYSQDKGHPPRGT